MGDKNVIADRYFTSFARQGDMMTFLRRRSQNREWLRRPTNELELVPMEDERVQVAYKGLPAYDEVLADTRKNTKLMLKVPDSTYPGEFLPVRDCAMHTILSRAGIRGDGLKRVGHEKYAEIINACLKCTKGLALIKLSDGKVSAVHGGDETEYKILDIEELFQETIFYLHSQYPGVHYVESSGTYDHSSVSAIWELSGNPELIQDYQNALDTYGIKRRVYAPALQLSTSDVAAKSVTIHQMLLCDNGPQGINLGYPIRLPHAGNADIGKFREQLKQIYPRYQKAILSMQKLLEIPIEHPVNTMIGIINRYQLGKKIGSNAVELFVAQNGEGPTNAHEIYYGLNELLFFAACRGKDNTQLLKLEEKLMRVIQCDWSEFDVSGTVAWK
ncbi:hypothetical protein [Merdimonas faecis]|uniref:hypothetical protein n=1 Tax=Merdimonas faecis TaxID=1653435 RepID=UPI0008636A15|nr:hypothetical protein [Merdimonas faecis]